MPGIGDDTFIPDWGAIERGNALVTASTLQLLMAMILKEIAEREYADHKLAPGTNRQDRIALMGAYRGDE